MLIRLFLALALSFGLSVGASLVLGLYHPTFFWIMSVGAALAGFAIGEVLRKRVWITLVATLFVRLALLAPSVIG